MFLAYLEQGNVPDKTLLAVYTIILLSLWLSLGVSHHNFSTVKWRNRMEGEGECAASKFQKEARGIG